MGTLYENIYDLCKSKGVKPGKMCADTGISKGLITDLKMGRKKSVMIDTAQKIADYFGVSVDRVLGTEKEKTAPPFSDGTVDSVTQELLDIWEQGDDKDREDLLAMARMLIARRKKD